MALTKNSNPQTHLSQIADWQDFLSALNLPKEGDPDFSAYPWPGILRILFWSFRLRLPKLRALALETIERAAGREGES